MLSLFFVVSGILIGGEARAPWAPPLATPMRRNIDDLQNLTLDNQHKHKVKIFYLLLYCHSFISFFRFRAGKYYVSQAFHNVKKSFLQRIDSIISTGPPSWI